MEDADALFVPGNFPPPRAAWRPSGNSRRASRSGLSRLALTEDERSGITHVIVTCCTGLYAPGLDYEIVEYLRLNPSVERTFIGFMGCYAAINALKAARHIVRSEPDARFFFSASNCARCTCRRLSSLEQLLAFLVFADGCAAYLVTAEPTGFAHR